MERNEPRKRKQQRDLLLARDILEMVAKRLEKTVKKGNRKLNGLNMLEIRFPVNYPVLLKIHRRAT